MELPNPPGLPQFVRGCLDHRMVLLWTHSVEVREIAPMLTLKVGSSWSAVRRES
jgi:hypothetical protein